MSWPPAFLHWVQRLPITKVKVFVLAMFPEMKNNSCEGIWEVSNQEDALLTSSEMDAMCNQVMRSFSVLSCGLAKGPGWAERIWSTFQKAG